MSDDYGVPAESRERDRDRGGAHVRRQQVFPSPRAEARARRGADIRRARRPVFVDDSGRRRRVARLLGASAGGLALLYVAFVGLTFTGVGRIDAAGLGQLTNPAGEQADVGQDPVEATVPAAVSATDPDTTTTEAPASPDEDAPAAVSTSTVPATTTTLPATTTTTRHGNGENAPSSTVPDKGGPPTSRPNG